MNSPKISEVAILSALRGLKLMDAETFCDRWHKLDQLSEDERSQVKSKYGYRAKCARLLSAVLRVNESTVNSWGKRFEQMPEHYKITLTYADGIRQTISTSDNTGLLELYLEQQDSEN